MQATIPESRTGSAGTLPLSMAVMSLGAAAIHFAVMGSRFEEYVWFGVFFAVAAWYQALWAIAIVATPTRQRLVGGLSMNLVIIGVWLVTRTAGVPIGSEPGEVEPIGTADLVATVLQVLIVAGCMVGLARASGRARWSGRRSIVLACSVLAVCAIPVTTFALATAEEEAVGGHGAAVEEEAVGSGDGVSVSGQPALSKVDLGERRTLQALVDVSVPETVQMHLTYFDEDGELEMASMSLTATHDGETVSVPVSQLEPGHFFADTTLEPGSWTILVDGVTESGDVVTGSFDADVP
jgi:hypothetical protein